MPDDKTPARPHARPAPVVVRSGLAPGARQPPMLPRSPTPLGLGPTGALAPLGRFTVTKPVSPPEVFKTDEPPTASRATPAVVQRLVRGYLALPAEHQRLVDALIIALRPEVKPSDR